METYRERERDGKYHNFVIGISRALHYVVGTKIEQYAGPIVTGLQTGQLKIEQ